MSFYWIMEAVMDGVMCLGIVALILGASLAIVYFWDKAQPPKQK